MADERTIFKKIIDGDIPADVVYQDDQCLAFRDISPQAPVHLLVIPRREIRSVADLSDDDQALIGHLFLVIKRLATEHGLQDGFRVVTNCGPAGGQSVDHLHFHLLGRRHLKWPPG